jgi:prepilin-type N-terminal cleavage/methylation domain-containing protein
MNQKKSFSLIELMVVVGIIAFLAAIAIPSYANYQARARQTEAAILLASLHTAEHAYFAQHGRYSTQLAGDGGIGWKPEGYKGGGSNESFYYTYGFNFSGAQEGVHYFTGKLNTSKDALGTTNADEQSFTAGAAGALKDPSKPDVWQIDQSKTIKQMQDGVNT